MKPRILVGTRGGKPVINWPTVLGVGLLVGLVAGAAGSGTWFLLTGEFSLSALILAVPLALGYFIGDAIRTRLWTPVEQLTPLDKPQHSLPRQH